MKRSIIFIALAALMLAAPQAQAKKTKPLTKHVILIGLDGVSATDFDKCNIPVMKSLMDAGCWTMEKRSAMPSSSAINWASMFMGAGTELHGYTQFGSKTPELPSRVVNGHGIFPTVFSLMREQQPKSEIGCVYEWTTIKCLIDSLAFDYTANAEDYIKYRTRLGDLAVDYVKQAKPDLFAVIFDQPDHEGHSHGWSSPEYFANIELLDGEIGRIIQAYKDAGIWEETTILITADHGGIKKGHGGITLNEMQTPFIIAGKNIRKGGEFHESMMQFDVASTIAALLGLKQPQVWTGRPMIQCFKKK